MGAPLRRHPSSSLPEIPCGKGIVVIWIASLLLLSGCNSLSYAPVVDEPTSSQNTPGIYIAKPGDTLYSIAWSVGADYRELAQINDIPGPSYPIQEGQSIRTSVTARAMPPVYQTSRAVQGPSPSNRPSFQPIPATINRSSQPPAVTPGVKEFNSVNKTRIKRWIWPVRGKIIQGYSPNSGEKGIEISGKSGTPIHATAHGVVVYSGSGLRGYGKLIIIKHNDEYLSAYAHNKNILVKEGQIVEGGQKIAEMGDTGADRIMLHFEIRKAGKPVNPLNYLM